MTVNLRSHLPYSLSNNNVPKDFNIFIPVFCAAITCQYCLRKSCKWANVCLQYQYVLCIPYIYKTLFIIYYKHFSTVLKLNPPSIFLAVAVHVTERCWRYRNSQTFSLLPYAIYDTFV